MSFYTKKDNLVVLDFKLFKIKFKKQDKTNKLIINNKKCKNNKKIKGLKIEFLGSNSEVVLDNDIEFCNCKFTLRDNDKIHIKKTQYKICNLFIDIYDNINIFIDEDFSCNGCSMYLLEEPFKNVTIGKDCLFSYEITIRNSDGHSIYDVETKELLNEGSDVVVGDHVWCGQGVKILKKSHIPSNSIIGANSLTNKKFDETNVIIAGTPASVIKRNVNWKRVSPAHYRKDI